MRLEKNGSPKKRDNIRDGNPAKKSADSDSIADSYSNFNNINI